MSTVSLVRCANYDLPNVEAGVRQAVALLGGIGRYVKPGDRVLLKVNLLAGAPPERAVTTHPSVVRAVARLVRSAGGVPLVGDCSAVEVRPSVGRYRAVCRQAGILSVCEEEGVELLHLTAESVEVENPRGRAFKRFTLARKVTDADVLISLPKLKTHGLTLFTGGVKNLFGCLPGLHKAQMHFRAQRGEDFAQMLVDLMVAVRPSLTLMDAVVGMDGNGPSNGHPKQLGALLASPDPVALDAVACEMVGISPMLIATTRLAHEQGVGMGDLRGIEVRGEALDAMVVAGFQLPVGQSPIFRATGLLRFLRGPLVAKPLLVPERCQGCWSCLEHCPAGAISKNGKLPHFDYGRCIHCYCCQELCPHDAIELKRPLMVRLLVR